MKPKSGKSRAAALNFLLARLREGKQIYAKLDDGGRAEAAHALNAVVVFLNVFEEPSSETLTVPLVSLSAALMDLDEGIKSPMLVPSKRPGRRSKSMRREGLRAITVLTLEFLRETGLTRKEAAKQVAAALNRAGVQPLGGRRRNITATTVINWRDSLSADYKKGFAAELHAEMKHEIHVNPDVRPERVRADVLNWLAYVAKTFRVPDERLNFAAWDESDAADL